MLTKLIIICSVISLSFFIVWTNPHIPSQNALIIYDRNHQIISQTHTDYGYQSWIPLEEIPIELQQITVAAEDHRFWLHRGVDPLAIARALTQNISSNKISSGASTIDQQVVRFLIINPYGKNRPSIIRKVREIFMAIRLNFVMSKKQILELYLNSMYFGHDVYGINTAAYRYFNKPVDQMSSAENALLVGLIANPTSFDPIKHSESAKIRRDGILKKRVDQKEMTSEEYNRGINEPLPTHIYDFPLQAPHFVDMVKKEVDKILPNHNQPLIIETTFDINWYKLALLNVERQVQELGIIHQFHNGAVVILENQTNSLLALVGNVNYFDNTHGGQINMARASRQPGSALKPFTYATAFNQKILTPASIIDDSPKVYMTQKGEGFIPNNYDGQYRGLVLAREALASSYNLPAVEVLSRIGIPTFLDAMHQFGITTLNEVDKYDYAVTLGGGDVNLLELTNAYAVFARYGQLSSIHFIDTIKTESGAVLYRYKSESPQRIIPETVAYTITDILKDPHARYPTFGGKSPLNTSIDAAVKTGTTTDWHDNWTIGYTNEFTVGVWIGNTDQSPMSHITGVTGAGPVWHTLIESLCQNYHCSTFQKPDGLMSKKICALDGLLVGPACQESYEELFLVGSEPKEYSTSTSRLQTTSKSLPEIIFPKNNTKFEISSFYKPEMTFEISHKDQIGSISWFVNNVPVSSKFIPTVGNFVVSAKVQFKDAVELHLAPVFFSVQD